MIMHLYELIIHEFIIDCSQSQDFPIGKFHCKQIVK